MPGEVLAVDSATVTTIGDSISGIVTDALAVITNNMPLVFGVALAFVAWNVGKRVLGKI